VASLDQLLEIPTIPRLLGLLLERNGQESEAFVTGHLPEPAYTQKAIETLERQGIIMREDGVLKIVEGEENSRRISAIVGFYAAVGRASRASLLFRGILNSARYDCMVHLGALITLMEAEGHHRADVDGLVDHDAKEGYVERLHVIYRVREGLEHKCFPFIPVHYYPHFITMKSDTVEHPRPTPASTDVSMMEEEYLLGHYPKEVANQAREYMKTEKEHIRERITNEAFDVWWDYRF
jgi:hypothetical protein